MTEAQSEDVSLLNADIDKCMKETIADMIPNGYSDEARATHPEQRNQTGSEHLVKISHKTRDAYTKV